MLHIRKFESFINESMRRFKLTSDCEENQHWRELYISKSNMLSEQQKNEVESLIVEEGGPHSTIDILLKNMQPGEEDLTLIKIYYIMTIRCVSMHIVDVIRSYGLNFEYDE